MATVKRAQTIAVDADRAWTALRRPDQAHRLFAPVLTSCVMEGGVRTVAFASGTTLRERIVAIDDALRRLAYGVLDRFDHHAASMEIEAIDDRSCRFVWISDFLPDERETTVRTLMEQGLAALALNLERDA